MIYYIDDYINIRCIRVKYRGDRRDGVSWQKNDRKKEKEHAAKHRDKSALSFSFSAAICYVDSIADNHPPRIAPHRT